MQINLCKSYATKEKITAAQAFKYRINTLKYNYLWRLERFLSFIIYSDNFAYSNHFTDAHSTNIPRALMTLPRVTRDLLMFAPSVMRPLYSAW